MLSNKRIPQVPPQLSTVFHLFRNSGAITIRQIKTGIEQPHLERTNEAAGKGKVLYTDLESTCGEDLQNTAATNQVMSD